MKKSILLPLLLLTWVATAQVKLGLRVGLSTSQLMAEDFNVFQDGAERFKLALQDAQYSVHGGLVIQARLGPWVVQPEVLFNSSRADYQLEDLQSPDEFATDEKYNYLDIPLMVGYRLGPLRLQAGPVGHVFLSSTSGLTDIDGFEEDFKQLTLGWQGGLGLDVGKLIFDVRYEGNFNKFGDHITFAGNSYTFSQRPSRFLFSVGYLF